MANYIANSACLELQKKCHATANKSGVADILNMLLEKCHESAEKGMIDVSVGISDIEKFAEKHDGIDTPAAWDVVFSQLQKAGLKVTANTDLMGNAKSINIDWRAATQREAQ